MAAALNRGPLFALAAALLFGASTPVAKLLLAGIDPVLLAAMLYLGSGFGLALWRALRRRTAREPGLTRGDVPWLAGGIVAGGIIAPLTLMLGLARTAAASTSLLLNLEGVFTAAIAWLVFREAFDRRIAIGIVLVTLGAVVVSWSGGGSAVTWGALLVVIACAGWAVDNNLTRRVSGKDATQIAMIKGIVAGIVNGTIALSRGASIPSVAILAAAAVLGFASYGISLTLFVRALRAIGAARTSAYFSTAPFAGAILSLAVLQERATVRLAFSGLLMAAGVWLLATERMEEART